GSGAAWQKGLQAWPHLQYVAADNGTGMQLGLERIQQERQQAASSRALEVALDVFHTRREGGQALRRDWSAAEQVWEEAEQADRDLARTRRRGQDSRGDTQRARRARQRAGAAGRHALA